jgi:hypothetical protein
VWASQTREQAAVEEEKVRWVLEEGRMDGVCIAFDASLGIVSRVVRRSSNERIVGSMWGWMHLLFEIVETSNWADIYLFTLFKLWNIFESNIMFSTASHNQIA